MPRAVDGAFDAVVAMYHDQGHIALKLLDMFDAVNITLGLPIVLILAWFHGDRGHQKPVRAEIAILALLLLVGGAGLWVYQPSTESAHSGSTPGGGRP
jgi:hypothetical protein